MTHFSGEPLQRDVQRCSRCVYDETIPGIVFDDAGICNYCLQHDQLEREYPNGAEGQVRLQRIAEEIRQAGRGRKYDCIVGVSGGCDSSFLLWKMQEIGLRPLAVHFDNTWNTSIATQNIYNVLRGLNIDLFTNVMDNKEAEDLYRSFLLSGVQETDAPTDIGLAATLYMAAEKYGIRYIIEGHSFRTEGIAPLGWTYMDGKYISSIQKQYGTVPLKTFPNMPITKFLKWVTVGNIRRIRPLYYMDYNKEEAKKLLIDKFGWQWYGGHHLENRFTAFCINYLHTRRGKADLRMLGHAALVRCGQMDREQAIEELAAPRADIADIVAIVKKRLGFSEEELERIATAPIRPYWTYPTYKKTFERLRPLFWLLYKTGRVPKSFYLKFTHPDPRRLAS